MTNKEFETRFATLEGLLMKLTEKKPSAIQRFWKWIKPYIISFLFGLILCGFIVGIGKQPAASGGAANPFLGSLRPQWMQPSGSFSPRLSSMLPDNSTAEWSDSLLKSPSEPLLPPSLAADSGSVPSTQFYRKQTRRTR